MSKCLGQNRQGLFPLRLGYQVERVTDYKLKNAIMSSKSGIWEWEQMSSIFQNKNKSSEKDKADRKDNK